MDSDRAAIHAELDRVRQTFARHVAEMTDEDLGRHSNGTRWTNMQLADIYHYPTQHFDHHDRQLAKPGD